MVKPKRKLNLTIAADIIEQAKAVAEFRGQSLSELVQDFLTQLAANSTRSGHEWLSSFHAKHLRKSYREPSDKQLGRLKKKIGSKHA